MREASLHGQRKRDRGRRTAATLLALVLPVVLLAALPAPAMAASLALDSDTVTVGQPFTVTHSGGDRVVFRLDDLRKVVRVTGPGSFTVQLTRPAPGL
jgi:hypothetical protein